MLHFVKPLEEMSISPKSWQLITFREQTPPALVIQKYPHWIAGIQSTLHIDRIFRGAETLFSSGKERANTCPVQGMELGAVCSEAGQEAVLSLSNDPRHLAKQDSSCLTLLLSCPSVRRKRKGRDDF